MDRPSWIDDMMNRPWTSPLQERVERPINNLSKTPCFFTTHFAKSNERRGKPVVVFDHRYFLELWLKVVHLIDEVNDMKRYVTKKPVSKWEAGTNYMEEIVGKSVIPKEEDVATIMQWHKDTFPKATCMGQLEKWKEERKEFNDALYGKDKIEELADMFIVACAIMRFNVPRGAACLSEVCALREDFSFNFLLWQDAINKKMAKNRARKWKYMGNGNYHHIKETED